VTDPNSTATPVRGRPTPPRWLVGGLLAMVVLIAAAWVSGLEPAGVCACTPALPTQDLPPSPVVGVVVSIDQVSLTQVNSFEVRVSNGKTVTLKVGALDNATQFSLSHLATHMATGVPIRAFYRLESGEPVVYHLEDAVPATPSPAAT
jgi:hypothetical protein